MPFTPFHFGAGLAFKGLVPRYFSFSMFVLTNVAMDVEPLYKIWHLQTPLHGFSHTITGALLIAAASVLIGRIVINCGWQLYAKLVVDSGTPFHLPWISALSGAFLGTSSHLLLDGVMHADMHPFSPLTNANPLLMPDRLLELHLACLLAGMTGMVLILVRAVMKH